MFAPDTPGTMTSADLQATLTRLGLGAQDLARFASVPEEFVREWLAGRAVAPSRACRALHALDALSEHATLDLFVEHYANPGQPVVAYRTDEEFHAARPEMAALPATFWDQVLARVRDREPALLVSYEQESVTPPSEG